MRVFMMLDSTLPFKHVLIEEIVLAPDLNSCAVTISKWDDYDDYIERGKIHPEMISDEVITLDIDPRPERLLDFIYEKVAEMLPPHKIIYSRPVN